MLNIASSFCVGKGKHRACYVHPKNENLCIKVILPSGYKGALIEAKREVKYYRLLEKKGIPWTMVPAFHGEISTDLGKGYVFDLIRDYDGAVSGNLEEYLSNLEKTRLHAPALSDGFDRLKEYLLRWKIITMNLEAKNLVYQRISTEEGRLIIVDNVGNSDFIPISSHIDFFAVSKIRRKWRRFESLLLKEYPANEFLKKKFSGQ